MGADPRRTCIACRTADPASGLVRLAWPAGTGQPVVDRLAPGRGAWLHPTESCIGALRPGDLARALRRTVSPDELGGAIAACRAAAARVGGSG
jgi:predicted RNA-binding protein YlxR (DUF448 family)